MKIIDLSQKAAVYNGRNYISADSIKYNGETIYHLVADNDDLYCYLKTNDIGYRTSLVPISDEDVLKNAIGIFTPPTMTAQISNIAKDESMRAYQDNTNGDTNIKYFNEKVVSNEKKNLILDFASNHLKVLANKGYKINIDKALSKIKSTTFTEATLDSESLGFYIEEDKECVLDRNLLDNLDDPEKQRALLRQLCFAIAGSNYTSEIFLNDNRLFSMVDGKINKICEDVFTNEDVTSEKELKDFSETSEGKIKYNFSEHVKNKEAMSMINQMEYLTGMKAGNDIFDGKNNFDTAFINMYGRDLFNFLNARMNRLTSEANYITADEYIKLTGKEYGEYFGTTQNILMYEVFNKELEKIVKQNKKIDFTEAEQYFAKLKGFKECRGQISYSENDLEKHDRSFDSYYSLVLDRVCREMAKEDKESSNKLYEQYYYETEQQPNISEINDQFKLLIINDNGITKTEIDEVSKALSEISKNNSKVVIDNER